MREHKIYQSEQPPVHPMMALLTRIKTTKELEDGWDPAWNRDIDSELTYYLFPEKKSDDYGRYYWKVEVERPIYYAISQGKGLIATAFLKNKGASWYIGKTLVNHAREGGYGSHYIQSIINQGYPAVELRDLILAASNSEIFDLLHKNFEPSNKKTFKEMLQEDFLSDQSKNTGFFNALSGDNLSRKELKSIYLEKIKNSRELRSILKMGLILGIENQFIKFLRTSKEHVVEKDTAHYNSLIKMLKAHPLTNDDMEILKEKLIENINDENFKPKPAFAALYFTFHAPADDEDNEILKKHLMITAPAYTAAAKESLENLVKTHLTKDELKRLKERLFSAVKHNPTIQEHGQETLKADSLSPFTTVVCTQLRMRGENTGTTYRALRDQFGLFKQRNRQAQEQPKPEEHENAYQAYQAVSSLQKNMS